MHLIWRNIEKEMSFIARRADWRVNLTIKEKHNSGVLGGLN